MSNSKKIPKWVLLDQLHIDINIRSNMPARQRKELRDLINSDTLHSFLKHMIVGADRETIKVDITK